MNYKIYSNGKEVSDKQELRMLQDEAIGVFETMRAYNGVIFLEEEHLARLLDSARTVGYKPVPDPKKIKQELRLALGLCGEKNVLIRLTLWNGEAFVFIGTREIPEELYQKGVSLKTASFPRGKAAAFPYQAKISAYQQAILASTMPDPAKVFDWVFLDHGNYLTETRTGNFFLVKHPCRDRVSTGGAKAELVTPPEHLILNGVTRRFVIKCAHELGIKVRETPLTRHEFFNADEAFLSNTSWEVLPVRELDGRAIGTKVPGPVTTELRRLFKRRVQESCQSK